MGGWPRSESGRRADLREEDERAFGAVPTVELTSEQRLQLQALAAVRKEASFTQFVEQVTSVGWRDATSNEMRMRS